MNSYVQLRDTIKKLGRLQGERSTNEIIEAIDPLWRAMLKVRVDMLTKLKEGGGNISEIPNSDFLAIFLRLHDCPSGDSDSRLCGDCFSAVGFSLSVCPYCGAPVNGHTTDDDRLKATIDFDQPDHRPDWDIDYTNDEILDKARLKEEAANTPEIKPITQRDDIPGPTGFTYERNRKQKHLPKSTKLLLAWKEREDLCKQVPFSHETLLLLDHRKLRQIAYLFPSNPRLQDLAPLTKDELIQKILGVQDTEKPDPGVMPYSEEASQ